MTTTTTTTTKNTTTANLLRFGLTTEGVGTAPGKAEPGGYSSLSRAAFVDAAGSMVQSPKSHEKWHHRREAPSFARAI